MKPTVYQHGKVNLKFDSKNKRLWSYDRRRMIKDHSSELSHSELSLLISWLKRVRDEMESEDKCPICPAC